MDSQIHLVKEQLIRARELIDRGWTQGAFARDKFGAHVDEDNAYAICWCASGAIRASSRYDSIHPIRTAALFCSANKINGIITWNDQKYRTKEEVLSAFDKAIEAVK